MKMSNDEIIERTLDFCCNILKIEVGWDYANDDDPNENRILASYVKEVNGIIICERLANDKGALAACIAHEARHAWQFKNKWHLEEFKNYIKIKNSFDENLKQKIEVDANAFSLWFSRKLLGADLAFPKWYLPIVLKRFNEIENEMNRKAKKIGWE